MTALTQSYAERIATCSLHPLPQEVQDVAVLGFTDTVGVMLAGSKENAVKAITKWAVEQGGSPQSRVVGCSFRVPACNAALINATAAHALDYDDFAFSNHPSAVLVPTILAAADAHSSPIDGLTLLRAYAIGYEIWADVFLRENDLYYDKGWHPTSVFGPLGAAAAASVIWGLNTQQSRDALAIAASNAAGIFENFGTMAKPYHGGRAACVGIQAASLAKHGLHASATAIEGKYGLLNALSPKGSVDLIRPAPEPYQWQIAKRKLNIKKYPVVGAAQRSIEAALALRNSAQIDFTNIEKIVACISLRHAAVMPYHRPIDALQAKFSLEFAVVSALVFGAVGFEELQDDKVCNPLVQSLMEKVEIITTEDFEPDWRDAAPFDQITLHLKKGMTLVSAPIRRATGHADTPLLLHEIQTKFMGCIQHAGVNLNAGAALFESLQNMWTLSDASAIALP